MGDLSSPEAVTLRLILGDQLNRSHSWYMGGAGGGLVVYVMMEVRQETDYAPHHIQKVMAFFAAMRGHADWLRARGERVRYLTLDDPANQQTLEGNLAWVAREEGATHLAYQEPDEYRLDEQLKGMAGRLGLADGGVADTEHFITSRKGVSERFKGRQSWLMERHYRAERERLGLLMEGPGQPEGGAWNYDPENRRALPAGHPLPEPYFIKKDLTALHDMIRAAGVRTMGRCEEPEGFLWPVSREESLALLEDFATRSLGHFGTYEDAMTTRGWLLYHARLSFALNSKMLSPLEVVERCIDEYRRAEGAITLPQIEGFVRQIIGWREYMRGIYWHHMPEFARLNFFGHSRPLPSWYWTGQTRMACLAHSLRQSLDRAYAHHIQRLMVIGNFALLIGANPDEVDEWYLGVYIDALHWVEVTNTRGMSQFADGGIVGSKPYAASAAYINRMSDYCRKCPYDPRKRHGPSACPFNSLYWDFFDRHRERLERNPRIGMTYRIWDRMAPGERADTLAQAATYLDQIDTL